MSVDTADVRQLRFLTPPPGLEPGTEFTLAALADTPGLFSLTSNSSAARLFVLEAALYLPDYTPRLPAAELDAIGTAREAAMVLVVANPGATTTVNLSAPIVVNAATGVCAQLILEDSRWPLRHALSPA